MRYFQRIVLALIVCALTYTLTSAQVETVPAFHPVYTFLKRMEVKGVIERYRDAVLPLSRREIGSFLVTAQASDRLTPTERELVKDFLAEFQYDVGGTLDGFLSVVNSSEPSFGAALAEEFSGREKYLFATKDSVVAIFVNGLLALDVRRISGDALGSTHTEYVQFGGRIRTTLWDKLGVLLQGTNAAFRGSRDLLLRDPILQQAHTLQKGSDVRNFDFSEGYIRYDAGIFSAQLGRERLLWGTGYDQKMIASEAPRTYDFLRADLQYKSLKYTFLHAALLGRESSLNFRIPPDTTTVYHEPIRADKFFAGHRIEFSFPSLFTLGFQEMAIYSNRSIDLAYLNPFIVLESTQRSRGERDNVLWAFDAQTHFIKGLEFNATIVFDDLHFDEFFEPRWYNRYAYQGGMMLTDPLFFANATLMVEYTRVKPFVYAHDRSRENTYTSGEWPLGPRIGPNSDSWFFRLDVFPLRNLMLSCRVSLVRHGNNFFTTDSSGRQVLVNVGGDVFQGHRPSDPLDAEFLAGRLFKSNTLTLLATYEFVNQMWLDGWFEHESEQDADIKYSNTTFGLRVRVEL